MERCVFSRRTRSATYRSAFATAVLFGTLLTPGVARAQEDWTKLSPPTVPLGRYYAAMAYDTANQEAVMFGGVVSAIQNAGTNYDPRTWLWNGSTWSSVLPTPSPIARISGVMAYDTVDHVTVLFGGYNYYAGGVLSDTWVWDGSSWTQRSPAVHPPARLDAVMAYDERNQKVVLYGGQDFLNGVFDDTWVYDVPTNTWTQMFPVNSPESPLYPGYGRIWPAVAYDAGNQNIVLFGGEGYGNILLDDTWTWDGSNWTKQSPVNHPSARATHVMAYDPVHANTVLFGGFQTAVYGLSDTWTWDGSNWTQAQPATIPEGRESAAMVFDAANQQVMMFGGTGYSTNYLADTWLFGGGTATQGTITITVPASIQFTFNGTTYTGPQTLTVAQGTYALSTASPQVIGSGAQALFVSWSDSGAESHDVTVGSTALSITGTFTTQFALTTAALPSAYGSVTQSGPVSSGPYYDSGTLVTITAAPNPGFQFDFWSGDCTGSIAICFVTMTAPRTVTAHFSALPDWVLLLPGSSPTLKGIPATSPPARSRLGMTYDATRKEVIVFGGTNGTRPLNDTWAFDGTVWTEKAPPVRPGPRAGVAMGYGAQTEQAVIFGGAGVSGMALSETWVWDTRTQNWIQKFPATIPPARVGAAMAYDPLRGRVVMFGGFATARLGNTIFYKALGDTWEWNGADWFRGVDGPPVRGYHAMTWDAARLRVVLNGGAGSIDITTSRFFNLFSDTWTYDGTVWTHESDAGPIRVGHGIVYDPGRHNIVLFGGEEPLGLLAQDTWQWDGVAWAQVFPLANPDAREFFSMVYDTLSKEIVLFGGNAGGTLFGDTWAWK